MTYETFNADYVRRLADGDSKTGAHFAAYFGRVLYYKLRVRLPHDEYVDDLRQETLLRVIKALRQGDRVRSPEQFGSYVNGVCNNVIREFRRETLRTEPWDGNILVEPIDPADPDATLVNGDTQREVARVFALMDEKDRRILKAIYLDETPKNEVCRIFGVDAGYLRVLLFRAKEEFRKAYRRQHENDEEPFSPGVA